MYGPRGNQSAGHNANGGLRTAGASAIRIRIPQSEIGNYLISTFAPTSSNFFLIAFASSFGMPSLIGLGAPSTRSFASFRPSAVISRTTLMTLILLPPTSVSVTVNSVFSSEKTAAAAPPPPPPIIIGAAADTPSSDSRVFTSCESSSTLMPLMYSTTCCDVTSAIVLLLLLSNENLGFRLFLFRRRQHVHQIARDGAQHRNELHHRGVQRAEQPSVQLRLARQRRQFGDLRGLHRAALDDRRLDLQRRRGLAERGQRFRQRDRVGAGQRDRRRSLEELVEDFERRALEGALRDGVLDDLVARLRRAQLAPQLGDLGHVHALVVDQDRAVGSLEGLLELFQLDDLVRSRDRH